MLLGKFKITGHSMEPFLFNSQTVLASSIPFIFSKPKIGDVTVFKNNKKVFIKRIKKINKSKYFLIGDNKKDSLDSKNIGWISKQQILGTVVFKI